MPTARPLSALRPAVMAMADGAQKANVLVVKRATEKVRDDVDRRGRRFVLRGRKGRRVPLSASADVKTFGSSREPVGMVKGTPEGFWHIVQYGSGPHLIARNTTRSGRRQSLRATFRRFGDAESLGNLQPIRTPWGPRQYAHHPGHGTIARPWDAAMRVAPNIVGETLAHEQTKALAAAFLGR